MQSDTYTHAPKLRLCLYTQFLFCKLDPNLKQLGKVEDDVPMLFKRLNYPFQVGLKLTLVLIADTHLQAHAQVMMMQTHSHTWQPQIKSLE